MEHSKAAVTKVSCLHSGEHQMELLDCVAAKFHEEPGVFKLLVCLKCCCGILMTFTWQPAIHAMIILYLCIEIPNPNPSHMQKMYHFMDTLYHYVCHFKFNMAWKPFGLCLWSPLNDASVTRKILWAEYFTGTYISKKILPHSFWALDHEIITTWNNLQLRYIWLGYIGPYLILRVVVQTAPIRVLTARSVNPMESTCGGIYRTPLDLGLSV